ncbi:unnamed protein product [Symbiodinium natans]|uniref:Uncharacterized protein n=1 Tax=Symbiodinium natans TaxID=878477 RepID=A0A812RK28_9DINO|nr:unnamed protein product [Symbiodinium natans]
MRRLTWLAVLCLAHGELDLAREGGDCASSFVQLTKELIPGAKAPSPAATLRERLREQRPIPRAFGGLRRAGEAAEAEAILDIFRGVAAFFHKLVTPEEQPEGTLMKDIFRSEASVAHTYR